jgi:hypothetical protein
MAKNVKVTCPVTKMTLTNASIGEATERRGDEK